LVAYAVTRGDEPRVFLAEDELVLARVTTGIGETGIVVDVYPPDLEVWTNEMLDAERTSLELRMTPIVDDTRGSDHDIGPNA
jgi:hypothetical protein